MHLGPPSDPQSYMGYQILKGGDRQSKRRGSLGPGGPPPVLGRVTLIVALVICVLLRLIW